MIIISERKILNYFDKLKRQQNILLHMKYVHSENLFQSKTFFIARAYIQIIIILYFIRKKKLPHSYLFNYINLQ